ncbi:DUF4226 domain-containing protein [Mycobacterium conspicuum]|uniref:Uncharacterized protein n=1 Tax=Mycobacterium conspicuum TaxID=44010 RepID=A0A1X1T5N9_9MYCO|nr:DUF4226 domain-containing protein [Mycobacterium conspicuum]ORV39860.1 hypothetical protein AWC00_16645 [Mycobacterium conspicuum]BBZ42270.1 hypothetical protein MCNS_53330 [Mycobacterium conspicuum]
MATYRDVLAAVKQIRDRTGDPNAWQTGLTPSELVAVIIPTTRPDQLDAILGRIRQQHPDVFGGPPRLAGAPPASHEPQQGEAAKAIADAEAALAHQNSASSHLDLQVISAILNAHLKTVEGSEELSKLQQETEGAVRARSDLDTPAGARDFQRFLISKLRDIRAVVANASLDDTSKSTLMAAWTSLYDASKNEVAVPAPRPSAPAVPDDPPAGTPDDAAADPYLDALLDDPGLPAEGLPAQDALAAAPPPPATPAPMTPTAMPSMMPSIPSFGGGSLPGGSAPGWNSEGGLPLSKLLDGAEPEPTDGDEAGDPKGTEPVDAAGSEPEPPPSGPTVVTLPDGETVTAGSPQLAAVIQAAVGGTPIAEAFHQQSITIPPPGTAVSNPIDPQRVIPGDIGVLRDRHALALGNGKALLDGQIQHIATVSGPSFLGWEHPPATQGSAAGTPPAPPTAPARTDPPAPTRPAATSSTGD